jgi:hypothetical protein
MSSDPRRVEGGKAALRANYNAHAKVQTTSDSKSSGEEQEHETLESVQSGRVDGIRGDRQCRVFE